MYVLEPMVDDRSVVLFQILYTLAFSVLNNKYDPSFAQIWVVILNIFM